MPRSLLPPASTLFLIGLLLLGLPGLAGGAGPQIAGGYVHSLALSGDGAVWAWGRNLNGQLGDGTTNNRSTPVAVVGLNDVVAISGGGKHSVALKRDGTVWAWGSNDVFQLGDETQGLDRLTPILVNHLNDVIAVSAAGTYTVALKRDGTVWIWGCCHPTQGITDSSIPTRVLDLHDVVEIVTNDGFIVVRKADNTVWAWGNNAEDYRDCRGRRPRRGAEA